MADRNQVLQLLITARDQASAALARVGAGIQAIGGSVSQALGPLRDFGALLAATAGLGGAKELLDRADAYTRLTNQLRVATQGEKEYQAALEAVVAVARRSNADLDSTANLYGKIAQNAETLGLSQGQVADVTELVAKAMQLSGAEASAASGAILQLGQALGSGALRGDEFNSIMEASPKLMEALAAGLGVAVGELRAMAEAGQLTSDRVVKALLTQKVAIDEVYGKLPQTVGQAMTGLANAGTLFVGKLNEQTGATQSLASGLKFLAENMDAVAALMGAAFAASLAKGTIALGQQAAAILAAKEAAKQQAIASAAQQQAAIAAAQGQLAAAQAASNRALAEQRLKLQIVALMEAELGYGVVTANLTAARQAAAAAANNATAATQRYAAAQAALVAAQSAGTASVGLFARAMGFLTGPGGLILLAVSAFAGLYAAFSKQKTATDALTGSTDQYRESLKNLNSAQLRGNLQQLNDDLGEQEKVVAEAAAAVDKLRDGHLNLYDVMSDSRPVAVQLTEAEGALADARAKLAQQQEKLRITQEALAGAWEKEAETNAELLGQYNRQATAMDTLSVAIQNRAKYLKTVSDAQIEETEALLAKAEAEGKVVEVDRLTVQLAAQRATAARLAAELARGEATAATVKVTALENIEKVQGRLTPQEAAALKTAREAATAKTAEAAAAEALAAQLKALAESAKTGELATLRLSKELEALRAETERNIEAADRETTVRRTQIAAALELATAKGNEAEAARLSAQAAREEVEAGAERIQQLTEQQTRIERHINLLYEQANADGVYTEAERAVIEALKDKATETAQEIAGIEAKLPLLEQEARQAEILAGPIGDLTRLYREQTAEHERAASASERYYDTQIAQKDAAIAVAKAKGDEATAAALLIEKQDLEIEKADALSAAKAQAAIDAQNVVEAKKLEAAASESISEAEQREIDKLQEVADAKKAAAEQARIYADALQEESDVAKESGEAQKEAGEKAEKATSGVMANVQDLIKGYDGLTEAGLEFAKSMDVKGMNYGMEGIIAFGRGVQQNTDRVIALIDAEKELNAEVERLSIIAEGTGISAKKAHDELLFMARNGGAGIRGLTTDGEAARQKLEEIRNAALEAEQALSKMAQDLNREILQARGDERALLELEHQERLQNLEELYARSGELGAEEYQMAKSQADELHRLKLQQLEEEAKQDKIKETTASISSLANEVERAKGAISGLNNSDLSNIVGQLGQVTGAAQHLRSVL